MLTEVPDDWRWGRFGDLFSRVTRKNSAGCTRVLTASGEHGLIDQEEYFNKSVAGRDLSTYYHLKRGEFAYNRSSMNGYPVGAIKRLDEYDEGVLSTLYICFAQRPGVPLDTDFAAQLFDSGVLNDEIASITQVGARAHGLLNVKVSDFMEVSLPLPPLPEQKKIAAILSSVDEAIQATQAVIEQTRRVKEGLLQDLLTRGIGHTRFKQTEIGEIPESWKVANLGTIADVRSGIAINSNRTPEDPIEVPYLRVANVQDGYLDLEEVKTIIIERSQLARYALQAGDVLMNEGGDIDKLGRGDVWDAQLDPCVHQNHVFSVRCSDKLRPRYLSYLAESPYGKGYFLRTGKQTTNLASINKTQLRDFPIPLPPLEEQEGIVSRLDSVRSTADASQIQEGSLRSLKAGLLQDLLTGKVRVSG